jgi:hypothetical protein
MSNHSKGKAFKILKVEDLDFISRGATVVEKIDDKLFQTSCTQKCNCGLFKPLTNGVTLNICDNCKWAQAPYESSEITYCSKQSK